VTELSYSIWETYISEGAESQINIPAKVAEEIQLKILKFPDIDLFRPAFKHVAYLLAMDVVPEYITSLGSNPTNTLVPSSPRKPPVKKIRRSKSFNAQDLEDINMKPTKSVNSAPKSVKLKYTTNDRQLPEEFIVRTKKKEQIQREISKSKIYRPYKLTKAQKLLGEECTIGIEKRIRRNYNGSDYCTYFISRNCTTTIPCEYK